MWTEIQGSDAVAAVDYQAGVLTIRTNNGKEYPYVGVLEDAYKSFMAASSKGRAWAQIRANYKQG
ncbi:MAG TPA: KTSC domain-containing protein [Candidatus Angelobacter sp.]|nr:KTSC domain-containing protein [Candidatus Angelobacter sp.]